MTAASEAWQTSPVRICPVHGIPDCSPLLNGCNIPAMRFVAFEAGYRRALEDAANELATGIRLLDLNQVKVWLRARGGTDTETNDQPDA